MKQSEIKLIRAVGTLSPIKEAALQFCICKQLTRQDYLQLVKVTQQALEETETLTSQSEQNEREASKRMQACCRTMFGIDSFDLEPVSFPFLETAKA